jgi:hypothetical protein
VEIADTSDTLELRNASRYFILEQQINTTRQLVARCDTLKLEGVLHAQASRDALLREVWISFIVETRNRITARYNGNLQCLILYIQHDNASTDLGGVTRISGGAPICLPWPIDKWLNKPRNQKTSFAVGWCTPVAR